MPFTEKVKDTLKRGLMEELEKLKDDDERRREKERKKNGFK